MSTLSPVRGVYRSQAVISENPWRVDFPIFAKQPSPFAYLDTAATAQTPASVIARLQRYYQAEYASVHRGVYSLSATATQNLEQVRGQVANFIGATSDSEIIFTKGTTEAINLVANSYLPNVASAGDEIIVTEMEHHANLVPWQMLAQQLGLTLKVWPMTPTGELAISDLQPLLSDRTVMLAMTQISNVLGSHTPVNQAIALVNTHNSAQTEHAESTHQGEKRCAVLVDGAQAVAHQAVSVKDLGCDFYVFSGHKLYGPTGVGVLYASQAVQACMTPYQGGGAMIEQVCLPTGTTYTQAPWCFEAGTPHIAGILGLGAAIEYLENIGLEAIAAYEHAWLSRLREQLKAMPEVEVYGDPEHYSGAIAFNLRGQHAFDVGAFLDQFGIAIRTGHHCAQPLLKAFGQTAMCRVSVGLYNDEQDLTHFISSLKQVCQLLGVNA
uniref:aminotransferase class V-fold PLP-dependent enzyme n=1 Tax=Thaumasiovibrio occultus TaxID=1891184 RepID=UPI000B35F1FB|nr:SufS family cysteine desulfurase [Thaumasiovibrio occultus]